MTQQGGAVCGFHGNKTEKTSLTRWGSFCFPIWTPHITWRVG